MTRTALALLLALLALAAAGATTTTALAADATRASFTDIEDEVMCVACGVPLTIADSPQADRERAYIRSLVAKDLTKDQIKTELVSTYGDRVLALPKGKGFGLAAYLVPIAIVLAMLAGLAVLLPRWRRNRDGLGTAIAPDGPPLTDADSQRLAEDLARYDV
ncbi:cytochrome c-type biogenesis protein [Baekduia sp.]|uniref:cytochrome c-type biogenesis protein n=1 Tax=Baekduia sp. TaxID=2600305 RepID=UPI002E0213BB|nr:cytochrome c-type biogenesis protein CcmH [Baekduia sp.]